MKSERSRNSLDMEEYGYECGRFFNIMAICDLYADGSARSDLSRNKHSNMEVIGWDFLISIAMKNMLVPFQSERSSN